MTATNMAPPLMMHAPAKPDLAEQARASPNPALLEKVITQSLLPARHTDGIAIGVLDAFDASGKALVIRFIGLECDESGAIKQRPSWCPAGTGI